MPLLHISLRAGKLDERRPARQTGAGAAAAPTWTRRQLLTLAAEVGVG